MSLSIGKQLEARGWLQGSIIDKEHCRTLLEHATLIDVDLDHLLSKDFVLIVATQSCNLANDNVNTAQLIIAYHIDKRDGSKEFNKHPRELDSFYIRFSDKNGEHLHIEQSFRVNILEKVFISKELLLNVSLNDNIVFGEYNKSSFVDWLGAHYTKPALPTKFNELVDASKKNLGAKKARKKEKALTTVFLGIYVNIYPNRDIEENERYKVNLLGLVSPKEDLTSAKESLDSYVEVLIAADMDVNAVAAHSTRISVAVLQDYKRFYLDELSYGSEQTPPPDVAPGIY
ncbi:hypothetical protein [Shewanella sp. SM32]|uniref:hypothetical protein n=1 Tax=Shewanella sp. SM32 TaxID=2912796 RepID=UPI0021D8900B|nr:hypothetical protein [Shewanella sp. SM32]MCU8069890.1 hypothetical protein [Shewanella sp. SM32]